MAFSSSGRRLALEAAGTALVFGLGAYLIVNFQDVKSRLARAAGTGGSSVPAASATSRPSGASDRDSIASATSRPTVELTAKRNGHFFVEAEVNGRPIAVMVDTGATMVALTYDDARAAGIYPRDSDFTHRVNTANGVTRVAPVVIERIQIGPILVRNVEAAVLEDGKLQTTLLGMSFLGKLSSFQMKQGRLVLEE